MPDPTPTRVPTPLPPHVPDRISVCLWDFTWYTRTGPGEPFEDLDAAFAATVERGYDAVRICAMPFRLFRSGLPTDRQVLRGLGGRYAQRMRWYDVARETTIDPLAHLLELFRAARRHGVLVIVSSWEYQQSPAFSGDRGWHDALQAVPPPDRPLALAEAHADLVDLLRAEGLLDVLAYVELHNEVATGHLTDGLDPALDPVVELRPWLERGLARFRERQPGVPVTVSYAFVPVGSLRAVPDVDVAAFHPYVYGVLGALIDQLGLRAAPADFDRQGAAPLLRPDAPPFESWAPPQEDAWRLEATIMAPAEVYLHDWCDPAAWDAWLDRRLPEYRVAMEQSLREGLLAAADLAAARGIPFVLGEGWIGYTPLHGRFEEGGFGARLCRDAVTTAARFGALGAVVCSNAAPHHPMWADVALQQECSGLFHDTPTDRPWRRDVPGARTV